MPTIYQPDGIRDWWIECTRGASSINISVGVQARSLREARERVTAAGYMPGR